MAILVRTNQRNSARDAKGGDRFLITVNVLGSTGPIRFVVKDGERVSDVISTVLRAYAREGRRPVLGANCNEFLLYCSSFTSDVLEHWETLSSKRGRNFVLCKKQHLMSIGIQMEETTKEATAAATPAAAVVDGNKGGRAIWKTWFNSLKVSSH